MSKFYFLKIKILNKYKIYICKNNYLVFYNNFHYLLLKIFGKIKINNYFLFIYSYNKKKLTCYNNILKKLLNFNLTIFKKKIFLIGLGFRVYQIYFNNLFYILQFKLGYSHIIYLKVPLSLKIFIFKHVKIFIETFDLLLLNQFCSFIKNLKRFNSYKKKGIFFSIKNVKIKKSKKI